jgi:hypothetical protein
MAHDNESRPPVDMESLRWQVEAIMQYLREQGFVAHARRFNKEQEARKDD